MEWRPGVWLRHSVSCAVHVEDCEGLAGGGLCSVAQASSPEYSQWLPAFSFSSRLTRQQNAFHIVCVWNKLPFSKTKHTNTERDVANSWTADSSRLDKLVLSTPFIAHRAQIWLLNYCGPVWSGNLLLKFGHVFANTVGRKWNGCIWGYGLVVTITMVTSFLSHYWEAWKV